MIGKNVFVCVTLTVSLGLGACSQLGKPPPPAVYEMAARGFNDLPAALRTEEAEIIYVTDRSSGVDPDGSVGYGQGRSPSAAFGSAVVRLRAGSNWQDLVAWTESGGRGAPNGLSAEVVSVREIGRFPETPYLFEIDEEGNYQIDSTVQREIDMAQTIAQAELRRRLRLSPEKRVSVYVHGVQTHFDDFLIDVAKAWHFEGRLSVPIAYAWPAGGRGLLSAYAYDRESGEFTVPHLKQLFRGLARIPEIEAVNVYAHSRGTDVALTALRQVVLEALAAGTDARAKYKLENIVLVAPDLDLEVAQQRFSPDGLGLHVGRITLYANRDDTAIAAAQGLFSSRARVGSIRREQLSEHQLELLRRTRNVDLILYAGTNAGGFGHGYFRNSVVQADAILLVRDGRAPGVEHGRPLVPLGPPFWEIDDEYLR